MVYSLELFKETDGNDQFVAIAQNQDDAVLLERLCARDRSRQFKAKWIGPMRLAFVSEARDKQSGQEEIHDLKSMTRAQLEQVAGELGIAWNKNASTESVIEKITKARKEAAAPVAA